MEEEQVRGASLCTASYIELDYLYELDRVPSSDYRRTDKPDTRFDASIWSWKKGENGQGQSAVMSLSEDGRWISGFVADSSEHVQRYPAACMVNTGQFPPYWGLQSWFVTPTAVPLYDRRNARGDLIEAGANLACIAHHGLFVPPYNAHENAEIYKAARASGGGDKYWINYTNNPDSPHFVVTPQTFRFLQGGEPAPAQVTIVGVPNKTVDLKLVQVPSEATVTLSTSSVPLDDNGRGTFTIHLAARPDMPLGQSFAAGVTANYDGNKSALEVLPVQTFVTNQPDIQLNVQQTGHSEEAPIKVVAQITNITPGVKYQGTLSLYDLQDSPRGPVQVTLDSIKVVDWQIPVIAHTFYLPAGVHNLTAGYEPGGWTTVTENVQTNPINPSQTVPILILEPPDGVHLPAGSNTVTLSTTAHIELPSYAQTFSMPYGGALPAPVSLKAVGTNNVAISSNQPWLSTSWTHSTGRTPTYYVNLSINSQAQQLAPGTYQAVVTIFDRQSATNPYGMIDHVTVTLHVTTRLSASPARVELTTAHPETYVHLISANGGNVPFTVTSDAAWLTAESDAMVFKLVADPTKVGNIVKYATVSVHSEDAPEVQLTVKFTP